MFQELLEGSQAATPRKSLKLFSVFFRTWNPKKQYLPYLEFGIKERFRPLRRQKKKTSN